MGIYFCLVLIVVLGRRIVQLLSPIFDHVLHLEKRHLLYIFAGLSFQLI